MKHLKKISFLTHSDFERFIGRLAIDAFDLRKDELSENLVFLSRQVLLANSQVMDSGQDSRQGLEEVIQQVNLFVMTMLNENHQEL